MAGIRALLESGVLVAGGADNVQDPFFAVGRSDPLETATLLIAVGHLGIEEAAQMVGPAARQVMGLPVGDIAAGSPAELVAVAGPSLRAIISDQPADRIVFHRGVEVARTSVKTWVA
jgi:cytosine deaminase